MDKFFAKQLRPSDSHDGTRGDGQSKQLPKGVVLGKDGKPCRSCTSAAEWKTLMKKSTARPSSNSTSMSTASSAASSTSTDPPPALTSAFTSSPDPTSECPPDVDTLGNHTWTLLHTISATYPPTASPTQQTEMRQFLNLFSKLYPCWVCADDLRSWMGKQGNEPKVGGRGEFGRWMCEAHNEVNRKLGKVEFDCGKWEERWRTGWADGRCD